MKPRTVHIDMDAVREMHGRGMRLKAIAAALDVAYGPLANRTAAAGLRFRNNPQRTTMRTHCVNGHQFTAETSRICHRKNQRYRICLICHKRKPDTPKGGNTPRAVIRSDTERTRAILDLDREREHAPHWEKPLISRQIEELRA